MTTLSTAGIVGGLPQAGRAVVVRWAVMRTPSGTAAELRITIDARRATAELVSGGVSQQVGEGGPVRVVQQDGIEHCEVAGVVSLSLRQRADGVELLYARTPLLTTLGIAGGCCEPPEIA